MLSVNLNTYAQNKCVIDSTYWSINNKNRIGNKVFELSNTDILVLGITDIIGNNNSYDKGNLILIRFDRCGNKLFEKIIDSSITSFIVKADSTKSKFVCITNNENYNNPKQINFNTDGVFLNKFNIQLLNFNNFIVNEFIKLPDKHFMFCGAVSKDGISYKATILKTDSNGNQIEQTQYYNDSNKSSKICSIYPNGLSEFDLIGFEDSLIFRLRVDSNTRVINSKYISSKIGISGINNKTYFIRNLYVNEFLISVIQTSRILYLARLDSNLNIIKESYLNNILNQIIEPISIDEKSYMLPTCNQNIIIIDSNLNIIKKDSIVLSDPNSEKKFLTCAIKSSENNKVIGVGVNSFASGLNSYSGIYLKSFYTNTTYVKSILINCPSTLDIQIGYFQLSASVNPENASNKKLLWTVNDTGLATIDQTGLLKLKSIGNLKVKAKALDSSEIESSKSIKITGFNSIKNIEADLYSRIILYPNPSQFQMTIQAIQVHLKESILYTSAGVELEKFQNSIMLDKYSNGLYLVRIETDEGYIFKKLLISR